MKRTLAACVLGLVLGIMGLGLALLAHDNAGLRATTKKLEADVRTYAGKYLDQQENLDEERQNYRSSADFAKYELEQCRNKLNGR